MSKFKLEDRVVIVGPCCSNIGGRGMVVGAGSYDDEVLVEYDDGTTHSFAAWMLELDAEGAPTVDDMRAIFGEPVEGRDYDVMPTPDTESEA